MSQRITLPQGELALKIYEPDQYKGDAILVHGFTGSKEDFDFIGPLLADRGYRVFTADNRAQYESPAAHDESAYSMQSHARDVVDLAERLELTNAHLFGHSYGGTLAQRAFLMAPHLFQSLTIFCSGPSAMPKPDYAELIIEKMTGRTMQEAWDDFAWEIFELHPRKELMKRRWLANDPRSLITQARELMTFTSVIPAIAESKIAAHVIYGENDDAWPLEMQDQMAADLSARLTIIKGAGHCPNEDQPEITAEVIADFWDSL